MLSCTMNIGSLLFFCYSHTNMTQRDFLKKVFFLESFKAYPIASTTTNPAANKDRNLFFPCYNNKVLYRGYNKQVTSPAKSYKILPHPVLGIFKSQNITTCFFFSFKVILMSGQREYVTSFQRDTIRFLFISQDTSSLLIPSNTKITLKYNQTQELVSQRIFIHKSDIGCKLILFISLLSLLQ